MIALSSTRNAVTLALLGCGRAAAAARTCAKRVVRGMRHRRDAAILASVNDRMLADIGLTRGDVNDALAEPPWRDPTAVLAARVRERRANRRGGWPLPRLVRRAPSILPPDGSAAVESRAALVRADAA